MIRYYEDEKECYVDISGKRVEIVQADRSSLVAECQFNDLKEENGIGFSENLTLCLNSEDGFGTKLELVFLSHLDNERVDDATDFAHMVDSIPVEIFKDGGFRSSGLSISYTPVELAVIRKIALTENIYDSIKGTALKIRELFGLASQDFF